MVDELFDAAIDAETSVETPNLSRGPYQLLPPLSAEEFAQLEVSIRERGVEDPVSVDEEGRTLDGHHRRLIAERLGLTYETKVIAGLSEDEKRLYAIRRNTERRQLNKAQRTLVGMRAEPSFRSEAKARQGTRTDLSPNQAKSRRVWAAEESARLVGLPLTTYKSYRKLILDARKERSANEVDRAIETGTWDIAEVRVVARERAHREQAVLRKAQDEALRRRYYPTTEELEEEAKKAWDTHGLLGRKLESQPSDNNLWQCPSCEAYWPPTEPTCLRCGTSPTDPSKKPLLRIVQDIEPQQAAPVPPVEPSPAPMATPVRYVGHRPQLKSENTNALHELRRPRLRSYVGSDPRELAPFVVQDWSPQAIAELRDGVRVLSGWLAAFDTALSEARLGITADIEDEREALIEP